MNDMQLIALDKCKEFSIPQLQEQIGVRYQLISEMLGSLYPSILQGEIFDLRNLIRVAQDKID